MIKCEKYPILLKNSAIKLIFVDHKVTVEIYYKYDGRMIGVL